ncbi:ATP synthase subunit gamma [Bryobacterales bacterium F-183]|nr:ATP synthase subunit gamma [Bryobacterales bacterium F-183]
MPSLIDFRRRIRSVKNTQQITKAMKMVSAAKLRRAQDRVIAARPYSKMLRDMLANVAAAAGEGATHPLLEVREEKKALLVLVTADRGLCGGFNGNLIKRAVAFIRENPGIEFAYELVGRKGRDFFRKRYSNVVGENVGLFLKAPTYSDAIEISKLVMDKYASGEVDAVYLAVNEFKSVMAPNISVTKILPLEVPADASTTDYIYEEKPEVLLGTLLPRYVEVQMYKALLESAAAEHAARMTAMDSASSNAGDVIEKLTLYMNRVRQAAITKEIIEIVSGAQALG